MSASITTFPGNGQTASALVGRRDPHFILLLNRLFAGSPHIVFFFLFIDVLQQHCTDHHHTRRPPFPPTPPMRLSGLQREVLSLYRQCLRASRQKPEVSGRRDGMLKTEDLGGAPKRQPGNMEVNTLIPVIPFHAQHKAQRH